MSRGFTWADIPRARRRRKITRTPLPVAPEAQPEPEKRVLDIRERAEADRFRATLEPNDCVAEWLNKHYGPNWTRADYDVMNWMGDETEQCIPCDETLPVDRLIGGYCPDCAMKHPLYRALKKFNEMTIDDRVQWLYDRV